MHAIYLTTLLGAIVAAAPPLTGPAGFAQTARFDDLTGTPGIVINQVGNSGFYQQVLWRGFALVDTRVPGDLTSVTSSILSRPGVPPFSPPNSIAWGTKNFQTVLGGQAAIDTNYITSNVEYMDLKNIRFGCSSSTVTSLTSVPANCDITLTCNRADGTKLSQTFNFRMALTQTRAAQILAEPVGFTRCANVVFENPVTPGVIAAGAILTGTADDVAYIYYV